MRYDPAQLANTLFRTSIPWWCMALLRSDVQVRFVAIYNSNSLTGICAGGGYLIGPVIGSALWRFMNRHTMRLIEARDQEFHRHIVKNRVDPSAQSATNPVPDFYGKLSAFEYCAGTY